ncbi:hypothetical protein FRC06_007863 [Ceratobasidium sp. 370]|nr:hypothetical protein FRC06_007863 [Ceratobasidium sp. 370]
MDPATIAKQLMRMENDLFQKILPSDYVTWKNHYKISDWCQSVILFAKSDEVESRALIVMFFVRIAEECLRMRSFSTAYTIVAGLVTDFILGLSYTWRLVDKRTKISLKQISEIVTDVDKCKSALGRDSQALPILTAHLRELRRAHGGLDPYVVQDAEQLINFQNFEALWGSIKAITKYKVQVSKDPTASAYLDYAFSQLKDGEALQHLFKTRSEELKREEGRFYEAWLSELFEYRVNGTSPRDSTGYQPKVSGCYNPPCSNSVYNLRSDAPSLFARYKPKQQAMEDSTLREAVDESENMLLEIRWYIMEWADLNHVKSIMRQNRISADLNALNQTIDTHVVKFQHAMDLFRQQGWRDAKTMFVQFIAAAVY